MGDEVDEDGGNEPRPEGESPDLEAEPDAAADDGPPPGEEEDGNEPRADSPGPDDLGAGGDEDGPGDEDLGEIDRATIDRVVAESPETTGILPVDNFDNAMLEAEPDGEAEVEEEEDEDNTEGLTEELQEKYDQLHELYERAMQTNNTLQRNVIVRKMQDKSYDASEKPSEGKVTEHKYQNLLHNVHQVRLKLRLQQVKAARTSEELKNQLEAKRAKAIECRDAFQDFKRQIARKAEYARTGKKIPEKIIQEVEEFELDKDSEVEEVRGSNISLKNRLAKLEQQLRKKDELAENLHVIDFEQLKIENQTLNEKIEERSEELAKLRKKTVETVQIITHMREKVQFVQQEYQALKAELAKLDQDLAEQRDLVARTKHERDEHRADHAKLKQQTGIINSEHLTKDFDVRKAHIEKLNADIADLQKRHRQMTLFIKKHGGRVS